ncbi:MAG: hypothetical protein H7247_02695 [Polaromonas sp.]|nr:hypothetical protein [Gemmatimonadaceae bacterium]
MYADALALALASRRLAPAFGFCLAFAACGPSAPPRQAVTCVLGEPIGEVATITGQNVPLRTAPTDTADRVVNRVGTTTTGRMMYRDLSPDYPITALCRVPGWVQVVVGGEGDAPGAGDLGWVPAGYVSPGLSNDAVKAIVWNLEGNSDLDDADRDLLRKAARRVLKDDGDCRRIVDGSEFTAQPGLYFVTCKPDNPDNDVVYQWRFTAADIDRELPLERRPRR